VFLGLGGRAGKPTLWEVLTLSMPGLEVAKCSRSRNGKVSAHSLVVSGRKAIHMLESQGAPSSTFLGIRYL
jgi:hypothetical protein